MTSQTLAARFAALQSERERTWPPAQLAGNASQRQKLVQRFDPLAHPQPGEIIAPFALIGQDGEVLTRDDLLANGPAVLLFFRYGDCPACNIALPYYNETLWPRLRQAGIALVAVSAQIPVDHAFVERHGLGFQVTADPDYALGRALGITFFPEDQPAVLPGDGWIGATLGTHSYEITQPAVVIIDADATLRHLAVSPDWLARPETDAILARLPEVTASVAN